MPSFTAADLSFRLLPSEFSEGKKNVSWPKTGPKEPITGTLGMFLATEKLIMVK